MHKEVRFVLTWWLTATAVGEEQAMQTNSVITTGCEEVWGVGGRPLITLLRGRRVERRAINGRTTPGQTRDSSEVTREGNAWLRLNRPDRQVPLNRR